MLDVLRFLPANAGKLFPKLSPREASERARLRGDIRVISAANANSLMSNMSSFLNWAVNEELITRNPARGPRLPDPINKRDKRLPFSSDQLQAIFNAPLFRGCVDGGRGYNKVGDRRPRNARFWVPLIALFTGARLGEICQLDTTDVRTVDGVDCIVVSLRSLVGSTDKQLKTTASDRLIPIHPTLIDCGLLRFAEAKRQAGEKKLFDDIEIGSTGSRPVAFSKWFTQFLRACGAQRSRTLSILFATTLGTSYAPRGSTMTSPCCSAVGQLVRPEPPCMRTMAAAIASMRLMMQCRSFLSSRLMLHIFQRGPDRLIIAVTEREKKVGHDILLKEFVLDIDEDWIDDPIRRTYTARLTRDPKPFHDVSEWQTEFFGGAVGINSSSPERPARDRYAKEVLRLRGLEREAKEAGRYAHSRFTVGSWGEDAA